MKIALIIVFILTNIIIHAQTKSQLPNFSLDGVDTGTINIDDLKKHTKIIPKNTSLKVINFEVIIKLPEKGPHMHYYRGNKIDWMVLEILKPLPEDQSALFWIDNVEAIRPNGDTIKYKTPLKLIIKR